MSLWADTEEGSVGCGKMMTEKMWSRLHSLYHKVVGGAVGLSEAGQQPEAVGRQKLLEAVAVKLKGR